MPSGRNRPGLANTSEIRRAGLYLSTKALFGQGSGTPAGESARFIKTRNAGRFSNYKVAVRCSIRLVMDIISSKRTINYCSFECNSKNAGLWLNFIFSSGRGDQQILFDFVLVLLVRVANRIIKLPSY